VEALKVVQALSPPSTTNPTISCSPYDGSVGADGNVTGKVFQMKKMALKFATQILYYYQ
jgi:hypothetical protein